MPVSRSRWIALAAASFGQVMAAATLMPGLASIGPALQSFYDINLAQLGLIFSGIQVGQVLSVTAWGRMADRYGDRATFAAGLGASSIALAAAASTHSYAAGLAAFTLGSTLAAAASVASARTAMTWFGPGERGLAISIRQTSVPVGGALGALLLPTAAVNFGARGAMLTGSGLCLAGAVVVLLLLPAAEPAPEPVGSDRPSPLRDRRQWRLGFGAALISLAYSSLSVYFVLYLTYRHQPLAKAAAVYLVVLLVAAAIRLGAGRLSDRIGSRIPPIRWFAAGTVLVALAAAVAVPLPLAVGAVLLLAAMALSMSCIAITYAASSEMAGLSGAGLALGFQITVLAGAGAVSPAAFGGAVVAFGWPAAFAGLGVAATAGWLLLGPLAPLERAGWRTAMTDQEPAGERSITISAPP